MARRSGHSNRHGSSNDAGLVLLLATLEGLFFWGAGTGIAKVAKAGRQKLRAPVDPESWNRPSNPAAESLPNPTTPTARNLPKPATPAEPSTPYFKTLDNQYAWRLNCEDGSAYGIKPEDYKTRDAYNEALRREKAARGSTPTIPENGFDADAGLGSDDENPGVTQPSNKTCKVSLLSNGRITGCKL